MKKFFIIIAFILIATSTCFAGDYYIAQTDTGAANGTSCANANAIADLTWGVGNNVKAGDTLHLCGTITTKLTIGDSGSEGLPITIKFESGAKLSAAYWGDAASAAIYGSSKNYIIIDGGTNGIIEATNNGSASLGYANQVDSRAIETSGCSNLEIKNLTIQNMYIREADSADSFEGAYAIVITGGSNISVHDNVLNNCETGIGFVYPGSATSSTWSVYNNTITAASNGITVGSGNTNAILNGCSIYNNTINLGQTWSGDWAPPPGDGHKHNDGIQIWSTQTGSEITSLLIYNNSIGPDMGYYDDAGTPTSQTTAWIFLEGKITSPKVFNNLITSIGNSYPTNAYVYLKDAGYGLANPSAYNNTIVAGGGGAGFQADTTVGATIKNNIYSGSGIFSVENGLGSFISNYNNIYGTSTVQVSFKRFTYDSGSGTWTNCEAVTCTSGGTAIFFRKDDTPGTIELRGISGTCASGDTVAGATGSVALTNNGTMVEYANYTLAGWQSTDCQDANSVTGDPLLNGDYTLATNSPAKWAGTATTQLSTTDKSGNPWHSPPSMGAYEYTGNTTLGSGSTFTLGSGAGFTLQ